MQDEDVSALARLGVGCGALALGPVLVLVGVLVGPGELAIVGIALFGAVFGIGLLLSAP